jgi:hypothetical protein
VSTSLPSGTDSLFGGVSQGSTEVGGDRCGAAGPTGAQGLEDARRSSSGSPAAAQQRRKRVLAIKSDTDDEVQDVAQSITSISS